MLQGQLFELKLVGTFVLTHSLLGLLLKHSEVLLVLYLHLRLKIAILSWLRSGRWAHPWVLVGVWLLSWSAWRMSKYAYRLGKLSVFAFRGLLDCAQFLRLAVLQDLNRNVGHVTSVLMPNYAPAVFSSWLWALLIMKSPSLISFYYFRILFELGRWRLPRHSKLRRILMLLFLCFRTKPYLIPLVN